MLNWNKGILGLVICCMCSYAAKADVLIPFELVNGLIVIEAEVDGESGNFIVDSGANGVLLNHTTGASDVSYQSLTTTLEGSERKIESLRVGEFELGQLLGFSTDLRQIEAFLEKPLHGILGYSVFTPNSLIFDFAASKLHISENILTDIDHEGLSSMPFYVFDDLPMVDLRIDGQTYSFVLDTGASSHFIDKALRETLASSFVPTGVQKSIITTCGSKQISNEYETANFWVGTSSFDLRAFEKDFQVISKELGKDISGLLSISKLSDSKVLMDLRSKNLYFE